MDRHFCDELEAKVFAVVDKWVHEEKRSFTAYDVTQALRADTEVNIEHRKVKVAVRDLYDGGEMDEYSTGIRDDIPGHPVEYRPPTDDEVKPY